MVRRFRRAGLHTGINLGRLERQPVQIHLAARHVEIVRDIANGLSPAEIAEARRVTRQSLYYVRLRLMKQLAQVGIQTNDFYSAAFLARLLAPKTFCTPEDNELRDSILSVLAVTIADQRAEEP